MLLQINIENFALIQKLSISFDKGFNVFSGETGAGKSILIDAIAFILGGKFSRDSIRTGEEKAYVEAVFSAENNKTNALLEEMGIEHDEDIIILSREAFQSGKSIARINNKSVLLSAVKAVGSTLLDIHGQHENQNLLDPANHIYYLDSYAGEKLSEIMVRYREVYNEIDGIDHKLDEMYGKDNDRDKIIDFLNYQVKEIDDAKLKKGEDTELQEQYSLLSNAEKINNALAYCYDVLYSGNDNMPSVYDSIGNALKELKQVEKHLDKIKKISDSLENTYYCIEQDISDLRSLKGTIYFDEKELDYINSRIYQIDLLKKKYGNSIDEILEFRDKKYKELQEITDSEKVIADLKSKKEKLIQMLNDLLININKIRSKSALELEKKIKAELAYIGLNKCEFIIEIQKMEKYNQNGADRVQFLISPNPGEPVKPLEKVASGGELSRIMLALKTVFIDKDEVPSVIFDEVDTGISGRIAQSVAEKMYCLSQKHQVFCVTHLPQIACMSDSHFLVSKFIKNDKTYTSVIKIGKDEKEYEIARMIGSAEVTKITLQNSKELIKLADMKKIQLNNAS